MAEIDLSARIGGLELSSPLLIASGTCGYGLEMLNLSGFDWEAVGAVVLKGTTLKPRAGNAPPRIAEVPAGLVNSIGLENPGVEKVVSEMLPRLVDFPTKIIANAAGFSVEEYVEVCRRLSEAPNLSGIELNVSCPNVEKGSAEFGQDREGLWELVENVRRATELPLMVKLSPDAQPVEELAKVALAAGADAIALVNTAKAMAIDVERRKPLLGNVTGGLSGPALRPIAVARVYEVRKAIPDATIVGMGGIRSAEDALEFVIAGASAFAVGTGFLLEPDICPKIVRGVREYLERHGFGSLSELVGTLDAR